MWEKSGDPGDLDPHPARHHTSTDSPSADRPPRSYNCPLTPAGGPSSRTGVEPMTSERAVPLPRCRSLMGVRVVGTGKYVPDMVVSNDHLHARLGFDSDWLVKRTGTLERRHAAPHQATSDLCIEAANDLFAKTGRTAS